MKLVVVIAPFAAMLLNIGSWWLTHYQAVFAYTVIAGGALACCSWRGENRWATLHEKQSQTRNFVREDAAGKLM